MKLTVNNKNFRVYFRYKSVEEFEMKTKILVHSNNTIQKTVITGTKHIVEVILINSDTNEFIMNGVETCSMHDVYNKRLGMALAILELLTDLSQIDGDEDMIHEICNMIYSTHFGYRKNVQYDMELESILTK